MAVGVLKGHQERGEREWKRSRHDRRRSKVIQLLREEHSLAAISTVASIAVPAKQAGIESGFKKVEGFDWAGQAQRPSRRTRGDEMDVHGQFSWASSRGRPASSIA